MVKTNIKLMEEIKARIDFFKNQRSRSVKINIGNLGVISEAKEEAKKIYEEIVYDGCGEKYFDKEDKEYMICRNFYCPNCRRIKEIWEKLNSEEEVKTCSTKHIIPPKSKDSGILPNFT